MMNYLSTAIRAECLVSFTWTTLYDAINRRRTPHTCDFNYEPRLSELMGGKHVSNFTQCVRPIYLQRAALSILYWQTATTARRLAHSTKSHSPETFFTISLDTVILTFRRRNYFLILAHHVYKMWIIQEPNTLELWNKLNFEEEKTESTYHV